VKSAPDEITLIELVSPVFSHHIIIGRYAVAIQAKIYKPKAKITNYVLFYKNYQLMLEARVVLRLLGREMRSKKISLLQSVAAILAVEFRLPSQRLNQVEPQPIVQSQGAIAKLLPSQLTIAAFATL
jgi:hypothetical protein